MATQNVTQAEHGHSPASISRQAARLNAHDPEHVHAAFERIASCANQLSWFLTSLADRISNETMAGHLANDAYCASTISDAIGAISDSMIDGEVPGSMERWLISPNLDPVSKEGGAA